MQIPQRLFYDLGKSEVLGASLAGLLTVPLAALAAPVPVALSTGYLVASMILIIVVDLRHFIIPDGLSLPAIPLGLLTSVAAFQGQWQDTLVDGILASMTAAAVLYGVRLFYLRWRGLEGLGLGDVKLAAAAGAWVGLDRLALACLLATVTALLAVFLYSLATRSEKPGLQTAIPFGCFIAPAILAVWGLRLLEL
ncbi:MAG: prepilin peptidase [Alphaproteobacteria bacterium]|nr:prepilin peptidase [Alphaproteobacteria bacterium]